MDETKCDVLILEWHWWNATNESFWYDVPNFTRTTISFWKKPIKLTQTAFSTYMVATRNTIYILNRGHSIWTMVMKPTKSKTKWIFREVKWGLRLENSSSQLKWAAQYTSHTSCVRLNGFQTISIGFNSTIVAF